MLVDLLNLKKVYLYLKHQFTNMSGSKQKGPENLLTVNRSLIIGVFEFILRSCRT